MGSPYHLSPCPDLLPAPGGRGWVWPQPFKRVDRGPGSVSPQVSVVNSHSRKAVIRQWPLLPPSILCLGHMGNLCFPAIHGSCFPGYRAGAFWASLPGASQICLGVPQAQGSVIFHEGPGMGLCSFVSTHRFLALLSLTFPI